MTLFEAIKKNDKLGIEAASKALFTNDKVIGQLHKWKYDYGIKEHEVEEVFQNGMGILYENMLFGKFKGDSEEETYLLGICHNLIRSRFKPLSKEMKTDYRDDFQQLPLLDKNALSVDHPSDLNMDDDDAEQLKAILRQEINKLSPKCQATLAGYYEEGLSMALLAEKIGVKNKAQAKKKAHTCREHLRKALFNNPIVKRILNL